METIVVHFSQNKLKEEKSAFQNLVSRFFNVLNCYSKHNSHHNITPYPALTLIYIYSSGIFILPALINVSAQLFAALRTSVITNVSLCTLSPLHEKPWAYDDKLLFRGRTGFRKQ